MAATRRPDLYDLTMPNILRSRRPRGLLLTILVVVALAACGGAVTGASSAALSARSQNSTAPAATAASVPGGDWTTFDYNAVRSGVGPADTGITAANLHSLRRLTIHIDGTVDSSPVELHALRVRGRTRDVFFVTTDYGRTLALDADTGARLWQFQESDYSRLAGSAQITTATPVIDPDRRFIYVSTPNGYIHKLNVVNGHQVWATRITFDPTKEKIAGALNIEGNAVIAVTGGYDGDYPVYQGHIVLINRGSGHITAVWNSLCSDRRHLIDPPSSCPASDSAIFGRAGSVVLPNGNILIATGNAPFNGTTNWGDSVLELSPNLTLLHNYTPTDQNTLNVDDVDLGSTSPTYLGVVKGMPLVVQGGKDSMLKLLNLDRLDGTSGPAGPTLGGQLQEIKDPGYTQDFSTPAVWTSPSGDVNLVETDAAGTGDYYVGSDGLLHVAWENDTAGTSPVIAGGLLYVYDQNDGLLKIYRPSSGQMLDSLPAAPGHWNSPIVIGGRIIVPEGDDNDHLLTGQIDIYHLPGH